MGKPELDKIADILCSKSAMKQDIFANTISLFNEMKEVAVKVVEEIKLKVCAQDERIMIEFIDKSKYEFHIKLAGDVIVFNLHSNVFKFDESHPIWKTPYLSNDNSLGYTGIINVYNFLADSFKYNRVNDTGYLIGRVFINREKHFITEGKSQLGFLYSDFANLEFNTTFMADIMENLMIHILEFDLYAPLYEVVSEVSLHQIKTTGDTIQLKTGKRMGFQFGSEQIIK